MKKKLLILPLMISLTLSGCGAHDHFKEGGHKIGLLKAVYGPIPSMAVGSITKLLPTEVIESLNSGMGALGDLGDLGISDYDADYDDDYEDSSEAKTEKKVYKIPSKNIVKIKDDKRGLKNFRKVFEKHGFEMQGITLKKTEFGDSFVEQADIKSGMTNINSISGSFEFNILEFKSYKDLKKAEKKAIKLAKEKDKNPDLKISNAEEVYINCFRNAEYNAINGKFLFTYFNDADKDDEARNLFLAIDKNGKDEENLEKGVKKKDAKLNEVYDLGDVKLNVKNICYSKQLPYFNINVFKLDANSRFMKSNSKYKILRQEISEHKPKIEIKDPKGQIKIREKKEGMYGLDVVMAARNTGDSDNKIFSYRKIDSFAYIEYGDIKYSPSDDTEKFNIYNLEANNCDLGYVNFELPDKVIANLDDAKLIIKIGDTKLIYKLNKDESSYIKIDK